MISVLTFLLNLLVFILVLGVIILLHELGHFFVAKKIGVLCHEYSIGMGPAIYQYKKGETTYSIRAIPIGGFVSLAGEDNNDAMFSVGDTLGLRLNDEKQVIGIVLSQELEYDVLGKVVNYELYDREQEGLFVEIELEDSTIERYDVLDDAKYYWGKKKEIQIAPKERSLESKPKWQRFLVMFAGPLMNFVLAILLFIFAYALIGKPVNEAKISKVDPNGPLSLSALKDEKNFTIESVNGVTVNSWDELSLEIQKYPGEEIVIKVLDRTGLVTINTRVDLNILGISNLNVETGIISEQLVVGQLFGVGTKSGLEPGDKITAINGDGVATWGDLVAQVNNLETREIVIDFIRNERTDQVTYNIIPKGTLEGQGIPATRVLVGIERATKFNLGYALQMGFVDFGDNALKIFRILGALFTPKTSGVSVTDLAGPIGIFNLVAQVRQGGFAAVILFMGFLSVNVGLINLMPIPALDGGRILFLGIEAVTRKPLNRKVETWVNNIAFLLLMALFVVIMVFDVIRIF